MSRKLNACACGAVVLTDQRNLDPPIAEAAEGRPGLPTVSAVATEGLSGPAPRRSKELGGRGASPGQLLHLSRTPTTVPFSPVSTSSYSSAATQHE